MLGGQVGKRCGPAPESVHDAADLQTSGRAQSLPPEREHHRIHAPARIYRCNRFRRKLFS
jgi:hypothetical protein